MSKIVFSITKVRSISQTGLSLPYAMEIWSQTNKCEREREKESDRVTAKQDCREGCDCT